MQSAAREDYPQPVCDTPMRSLRDTTRHGRSGLFFKHDCKNCGGACAWLDRPPTGKDETHLSR
jgi:hypothetical protein